MPNIKSAKKRVLVNEQKNAENKMIRSAVKTEIKKLDAIIASGNKAEALVELSKAYKVIDSAASKGIFHKNNAANKKSKLAKKVAGMTEAVAVEEVKEEVKEEATVVEEAPKAKRTRKAKTTDAE